MYLLKLATKLASLITYQWFYRLNSLPVSFPNHQGDVLSGILELPESPKAFAIYAHCFTCTKDIPAAYHICKQLTKNGIAALRFDFTGLGSSEGDFSSSNFSTNVEDILSAADFISTNYESPKLIIGHSLGGTTSVAAAKKIPAINAIVTIASPYKPSHVLQHFEEAKYKLLSRDSISMEIMGREFTIQKQMLDDIESYDNKKIIEDVKTPILIMHSPIDKVVSIEEASKMFLAAIHPKSFVSLDNINHLISDKEDAIYIADMIASWANRYIN